MAVAFLLNQQESIIKFQRAELRVGIEEAEARFLLIISFRIS